MADHTKIEWTEATWNPVTGCSVVSPGCTNCYAMQLAGTRLKHHESRAGLTRESGGRPKWTGEVRFNEQWLDQPLRWKRGRMIFVCAHGDLFHESVPDEWIDRVFAVMALCPQHTFQVLTKRSARMREYVAANRWQELLDQQYETQCRVFSDGEPPVQERWPLPNVWLGVSVEDQQRADDRIPDLLATPAAVRWISAEPLLGEVDLREVLKRGLLGKEVALDALAGEMLTGTPDFANGVEREAWSDVLDWIVAGGESGYGARPMHPDWARSLRDQCAATGVAFFFKQWGAWLPAGQFHAGSGKPWVGPHPLHTTKAYAGRLLDGVTHDAMPEVAHG